MKTQPVSCLKRFICVFAIGIICITVIDCGSQDTSTPSGVSKFGSYSGYSGQLYEGFHRSSVYITSRDGTRLAADILRPAHDGMTEVKPLPSIWANERYLRALAMEDTVLSQLDEYDGNTHLWQLGDIVKHGYVAVIVDSRGTGASFGSRPEGPFSQEERRDIYDVTEWIAAQPWCDGNVGMFGQSYMGWSQYLAAAENPPHLKAIIPAVAGLDFYDMMYDGGILHNDFSRQWGTMTKALDFAPFIAPVDGDEALNMRDQAIMEHQNNGDFSAIIKSARFRDSNSEITGGNIYKMRSPSSYLTDINASGVPIYHWGGWYDGFTDDAFKYYANCTVPQKLAMGPWFHMQAYSAFAATEHLRWYDYWLKDIDNGIMDETAIHYYTIDAPDEEAWRSTDTWPLPGERPTPYYFSTGPSGSVASANDGTLTATRPDGDGSDRYIADYSTTVGKPSRWSNVHGDGKADIKPSKMNTVEGKCLTYTTPALLVDTEITGHPVTHLWVTSTADDGDFFVYLSEVLHDGASIYVTEGKLRASHREITTPPYDNLDLPWHRSYESDVSPMPDEPVELVFDMQPTSKLFRKGNRIRITVACADTANFETPIVDPAPIVTMHMSERYPSHVVLPVIP